MLVSATMELVAHDMHAYGMHAYEMYAYEMHATRCTPRCTPERCMPARDACLREMHANGIRHKKNADTANALVPEKC
jgi:hypothetical protein